MTATESSDADSIYEQNFSVDEHGRRLASPHVRQRPLPRRTASSTTTGTGTGTASTSTPTPGPLPPSSVPVRPPLRPRVSPRAGDGTSQTSGPGSGGRSGSGRVGSPGSPGPAGAGASSTGPIRPRQASSKDAPIFRLNQDVLDLILPFLHPASLASLACTCVYFSEAVRSFLGFSSISLRGPEALLVPPSSPPSIDRSSDRFFGTSLYLRPPASSPLPSPSSDTTDETASSSALTLNEDLHHEVPLGFPSKLPHNGSVQIGTKIYAPLLGAKPVCNVLDLAPLRVDPRHGGASPGRLPQWIKYEIAIKDTDESWAPLVAPCAAVGSRIYFFGGVKYDLKKPPNITRLRSDGSSGAAPPATGAPASSTNQGQTPWRAGSSSSADESETSSYFEFHGVHSHLHGSSALSTGRPRWKLPEGSAADLGSSASSRSSTSDFVRERQSNALYWLDVETFQLKQVQPTKAAAAAAAAATAGGGGSPGGPGQAMGSGTGAAHPPGSGSTRSPSGSRGSGSTGTKEGYWPRAVKNHTLSAVEDRYIVCFGGRYPGSEADNSVQVFDTHTGLWSLPTVTGSIPPPRFGHATASIGSDLYFFGGAALHLPTIYTFGDMYRLDVSELGSEAKVHWSEFVSPQLWSFSGFGRPQRPAPVRQVPLSAVMGERPPDAVEESRFVTTGTAPLERIEPVLLPIGNNRLIVMGGRTVDAAQLPLTGETAPWDESFAWSLTAIDCFNLKSRHWSRIRSDLDPTNVPYMRELVCSAPFNSNPTTRPDGRTTESWSIVVLGQRLLKEDFTEPFEGQDETKEKVTVPPYTAATTASPMPSPLREVATFDDFSALGEALPDPESPGSPQEVPPSPPQVGSPPAPPVEDPPASEASAFRRTTVERVPSDERRVQPVLASMATSPNVPSFANLVQATAPHAYITMYHRDATASLLSVDFHLQSGLTSDWARSVQPSGAVVGGHSPSSSSISQVSGSQPIHTSPPIARPPGSSPFSPQSVGAHSGSGSGSGRSGSGVSGSSPSLFSRDRGLTGQLPSRPFFRALVLNR